MTHPIPHIRCPRLGHQVQLAYCYHTGEGRPCSRLLLGWEPILPRLRSVLAKRFTPEEWARYFETPPPSKVGTLVELVQKAKGCAGDDT